MNELITGSAYHYQESLLGGILNNHRYHELKFMPIYPYEKDLNLSLECKVVMLHSVIKYLEDRDIQVTFTDRIIDYSTATTHTCEKKQIWRYLPISELQGNNICINPRNLDFLSVFMSLGHIYGHLVQRMDYIRYKPLTDLLEVADSTNLSSYFDEYEKAHGRDYKTDFFAFEKEAFSYAKYTFIEAGISWNDTLEYAMSVYLEADFNDLWKWLISNPKESDPTFMDQFQKLWNCRKGSYDIIVPKKISLPVIPEKNGRLVVVRNDQQYVPFLSKNNFH